MKKFFICLHSLILIPFLLLIDVYFYLYSLYNFSYTRLCKDFMQTKEVKK